MERLISEILSVIGIWLVTLHSNLCFFMITSYHKSKPLGLQSLLGQVTVMSAVTSMITISFHGFVFPVIIVLDLGSSFEFCSKILEFISCFSISALFLSTLLILLTKYLSIYHSTLLHSCDEKLALSVIKLILIGLPMSLTLIEFTYLSNIEAISMYQILVSGSALKQSKVEKTKIGLFIVFLAVMLLLQCRLEADNIRHGESSSGFLLHCFPSNQNMDGGGPDMHQDGYRIMVIRLVAVLFTFILGLALFQFFVGVDGVAELLTAVFVIGNLTIPTIAIVNHEGLRHHCASKAYSFWSSIHFYFWTRS